MFQTIKDLLMKYTSSIPQICLENAYKREVTKLLYANTSDFEI